MSKLNSLGLELLELKTAINSNYPLVVLRSLTRTADELLNSQLITQEIHYLLTEPAFPLHEFKHFCLEQELLCKSVEELLALYEEKRMRLETALDHYVGQHHLVVENYIDDEQIIVVKGYHFGREEVKTYFGIEKEEDCDALMGRKRFIERFIALRFPKIMNDFLDQQTKSSLFQLTHSGVFHDEDCDDYAIELLFKIQVTELEEADAQIFVQPIIDLVVACDQAFNQHMGLDGQFYNPNSSNIAQVKNFSGLRSESAKSAISTVKSELTPLNIEPELIEKPMEVEEEPMDTVFNIDLDIDIEIDEADLDIDLDEADFEI